MQQQLALETILHIPTKETQQIFKKICNIKLTDKPNFFYKKKYLASYSSNQWNASLSNTLIMLQKLIDYCKKPTPFVRNNNKLLTQTICNILTLAFPLIIY